MQMRQQNGWLLVLSLSQESWLHVLLVALWYMCVPLCCLMWLCLQPHSKAIQLPVNWPVPWESVKNQIYNSVSVCSSVALQPDTTKPSPDVPTSHNSPVWNSTNPISAAVVSTASPHSWACHRTQIRPFWLLGCISVITPKNSVDPNRQLPSMDLWLRYCFSMPVKKEHWDQRQRAFSDFSRRFKMSIIMPCLSHTTYSSLGKYLIRRFNEDGIHVK